MNQIEQAFADLMAAARDAAGTAGYRGTRAGGAQEPLVSVFADRAKALVQAAQRARGAWVGIRVEDPSPQDLRKLLRTVDEFTLEDWTAAYDAAVRRAARDAGLNGQLVTQFGARKPAEGSHRAGYSYRIAVGDGNAR